MIINVQAFARKSEDALRIYLDSIRVSPNKPPEAVVEFEVMQGTGIKRVRKLLGKGFKTNHHIYDYVFTDSTIERNFVSELDASAEVVVYAKLPKTFFIPTPVGNCNPDWAITFTQDKVKHVDFIAETKGSQSSMDLRKIEESKIECARKFFAKITNEQVRYEVVDGYGTLMELVK